MNLNAANVLIWRKIRLQSQAITLKKGQPSALPAGLTGRPRSFMACMDADQEREQVAEASLATRLEKPTHSGTPIGLFTDAAYLDFRLIRLLLAIYRDNSLKTSENAGRLMILR